MVAKSRKITSRDLGSVLDVLRSGDPLAQKEALTAVCPCRSPRYDRHLWRAIFEFYHTAAPGPVREQAYHAILTLLDRARIDPRTQQLLLWLDAEGASKLPLTASIPRWEPRSRYTLDGMLIPRARHSRRSGANRRR